MAISHQQALARLLEGNRRYADLQPTHPNQSTASRQAVLSGQTPIAAILSCSDSRVPSELVFDQGVGDLFIVRTAGHTVDTLVLASLAFAVIDLRVPLLMVVGHSLCGAVTSVLQSPQLPSHLEHLGHCIRPALTEIDLNGEDALEVAVHANTRYVVRQVVASSPPIAHAVADDRLRVVGAYYDLHTGRVELLD